MSGVIKKNGKIFTWGGYNLKPQESRIRVGTSRAGWVLGKTVVHPQKIISRIIYPLIGTGRLGGFGRWISGGLVEFN